MSMDQSGTSKRILDWAELTDSDEEIPSRQVDEKKAKPEQKKIELENVVKIAEIAQDAKGSTLYEFQIAILRRIAACPDSDIYIHVSNLPPKTTADDIKGLYHRYKLKEILFNRGGNRCDILLDRPDAKTLVSDPVKKFLQGNKIFIDYSFKNDENTKISKQLTPKNNEILNSPHSQGNGKSGNKPFVKSNFSKGTLYFSTKTPEATSKKEDLFPVFKAKENATISLIEWRPTSTCEDSQPIQTITSLKQEVFEKIKARRSEFFNRDTRNQGKGFFAWGKKGSNETVGISENRTVRSSFSKESFRDEERSPRQDISPLWRDEENRPAQWNRASKRGENSSKSRLEVFSLSDTENN